jgi:hypothetical protein
MRENRLSGSEGGARNDRPYPYYETRLWRFQMSDFAKV